jgi:eukaryotic-like serine/threonine-protein kinase
MELIGQTFAGHYQVLELMGTGGMGYVYRARHTEMDREVALKVLTKKASAQKATERRFEREMRIGAALEHPHVVRIYEYGMSQDGLRFIAMEALQGESLSRRLKRDKRLHTSDISEVGIQVCRALIAVHEAGVVHRDLKPDNIFLLDGLGGRIYVKLLDFGIARPFDGRGGDGRVTNSGLFVGTPKYASPEQVRGEPVDGRSDLYSLGVVLYRCATGGSPRTVTEVMEGKIRPVPVPNDVVPGCLTPELEDVILQLIEPDVSLRITSAQEALAMFTRAAKNLGRQRLPTAEITAVETAIRWGLPMGVGAALFVLGLLLGKLL